MSEDDLELLVIASKFHGLHCAAGDDETRLDIQRLVRDGLLREERAPSGYVRWHATPEGLSEVRMRARLVPTP